jgi:hypothetical protein
MSADEPKMRAVSDDPAHPEVSGSHGEPSADVAELLSDIGSQCRFMGAILQDIQSQLGRIERAVKQQPEFEQQQNQKMRQ